MMRTSLYAIAALLAAAGLWGFYARFATGHEQAAYGSYVVWGLWVAQYLFFAGLAGGLFFFASLDILFRVKRFEGLGKVALFAALVSLGAGLLHIWLDLGHMFRIWKVFLNPNPESVMAQIVWGYTLFGMITLAGLVLTVRSRASAVLRPLMATGMVLALFLSGGVGALLGVMGARPFWHVGLLPVQFPVFSVGSAAAALLVIVALFGSRRDPRRQVQLRTLALITVGVQIAKLYFLWADFSQSLYAGIPENVKAVELLLFGPYWWTFWGLQLLAGSLVPILLLSVPSLARSSTWASLGGLLVLGGFSVARANIVLPALAVPEMEALTQAFTEPRLQFSYFPSLMEWSVTAGIVGIACLALMIGLERLPLGTTEATK